MADGLKLAAGGLCIAALLGGLVYVAAPQVVAEVFLRALGAVAQLWPGVR